MSEDIVQEGQGRSHSMDFTEIAQQAEVAKPQDYSQVKFEGDDIPEIVRGKTAAEALALISGMQESLRLSEQARQQALATSVALSERQPQAAPAPVVAQEPAEPTEAELKAMFEEDPFKYHQTVAQINDKRNERRMLAAMQPMVSSTASSAEQMARTKYKDEFDILGPEIDQIIQKELGGNRQVLVDAGSWDRLVKYAKGEYFDKFVAEKSKRSSNANLEASRTREANNAPADFTGRNGNDNPRPRGGKIKELDATQKEICKIQGISEQDYMTYYVGG
jgi:hypothetical protein